MGVNKSTARVAGVLYIIIIISGIFAEFFVRQSLIVPGDATTTAANITASEGLFRLGIAGDLIMILSDIALALIFYVLFKPVSNALSLLAAFFRLGQATILGINLLNLFFVLQLLNGADYLTAFEADQIPALVMLFLNAHSIGFTIGIAFLVPHVLILGYLIVQSGYFPKVLGFLFIAAGIGYLVDTTGLLLVAGYTTTPGLIATVIAVAEIAFPLWLLVKGVNLDRWQNRTLALETA